MGPPKYAVRTISQEAFDELVKENMDDLGMEPTEALNEAIETLTLQCVDLSGLSLSVFLPLQNLLSFPHFPAWFPGKIWERNKKNLKLSLLCFSHIFSETKRNPFCWYSDLAYS